MPRKRTAPLGSASDPMPLCTPLPSQAGPRARSQPSPFTALRSCLGALILTCAPAASAAPDTSIAHRASIEAAMRRANAYYQANFALGSTVWNRGAYHGGNTRAWRYLGHPADLAYTISWGEANSWRIGPEAGGSADADAHACGQPFLDLYEHEPMEIRRTSIRSAMVNLVNTAPASHDDWWWIDAFYMAGPTLARLARMEAEPVFQAQLDAMYLHMRDNRALFDPARGLWYRDATAKARTGANTPQFWGRGNGWVIAACARVLEQMAPGDPARAPYASMLQTMAAALLPLQGEDGFWRSNLLFPQQHPNPETSCTAFFTYAMAYGIVEGVLDEATYGPAVDRAWAGLVNTALQPSGRLGYVQPIGAAPASATADGSQDYAYGALLLAGVELLRRAGGPSPLAADAGPDRRIQDADGDLGETITLDASGTRQRAPGAVEFSWWLGDVRLGEGNTLPVRLPLGTHAIDLRATHAGHTYADRLSIQITTGPGAAPSISASGAQTGNPAANVVDGSLATRWSHQGIGQWLQLDLPMPLPLSEVGVAFYLGDTRLSHFDLLVSEDGASWTTVFSGSSSGTTTAVEWFQFPQRSVRQVRYLGRGNSTSDWNSVTEMDLRLEALLDRADTDADGLPDAWEREQTGDLSPTGPAWLARLQLGSDPTSTGPRSPLDLVGTEDGTFSLRITPKAALGPGLLGKARTYRLEATDSLTSPWSPLEGLPLIPGDNVVRLVPVSPPPQSRYYRLVGWLE